MKKINIWPLFVLALLSLGIFLTVWTITTVSGHKVVDEDMYMLDYRDVDYNINEIMLKNTQFNKKYEIKLFNETLLPGTHELKIKIINKDSGENFKDAIVTATISRYESSKKNLSLDIFSVQDNFFVSKKFDTTLRGRYMISVKAKIGENVGFKRFYVYVDGTVSEIQDNQRKILNNS